MAKPSPVCWLALGMFAWGLLKSCTVGRQAHQGCPLCEQKKVSSGKHLLKSLVVGPVVEELQFRQQLPQLLGDGGSAALFGALHASPRLGVAGNVARVVEAGLAGGVVYAKAYKAGGLGGAALVHAAHNLGSNLGVVVAMKEKATQEQWRHQLTPIAPGVHAIGCRRGC